MEVKKTSENYNALLKRKEITFTIDHLASKTPNLFEVRKALSTTLGTSLDVTYITKLETKTGTCKTVGEAEIYDNPERALLVVPKHIQNRNLPPEEEKAEKKPKEVKKPKKKPPTPKK